MVDGHYLAQINIAGFLKPKDDPANLDFMNALDRVNAAAEASPGFVWRLKDESGHAANIVFGGDPDLVINLSVWQDLESLRSFAYQQTDHVAVMRRRSLWFDSRKSGLALWWIAQDHRPDPFEAMARLRFLKQRGPSPKAFTFSETYGPA